jgi:hypothetical protein
MGWSVKAATAVKVIERMPIICGSSDRIPKEKQRRLVLMSDRVIVIGLGSTSVALLMAVLFWL